MMLRMEQLLEKDGVLYPVGTYETTNDSFLTLDIHADRIAFTNPYRLIFPRATEPYTVSHVGFFPLLEYTGLVVALTTVLAVPKGGDVSFPPGTIAITMDYAPTTISQERL